MYKIFPLVLLLAFLALPVGFSYAALEVADIFYSTSATLVFDTEVGQEYTVVANSDHDLTGSFTAEHCIFLAIGASTVDESCNRRNASVTPITYNGTVLYSGTAVATSTTATISTSAGTLASTNILATTYVEASSGGGGGVGGTTTVTFAEGTLAPLIYPWGVFLFLLSMLMFVGFFRNFNRAKTT